MQAEFITEAVKHGAGLADDCYELCVWRMFERQYTDAPADTTANGETVLSEDHEKASRITQAIQGLTGEESEKVYQTIYVTGVVPAVLLITCGQWDEAGRLYREMCKELGEIFLEGCLDDYEPHRWLDAWIEARLADAPIEVLASARGDAAGDCGVLPLERVASRRRRYEASHA